jgi:glycosyltransferase involved in cell wall biosynthesis
MHFGVPILAYDSSAIAGTLDGSGVLFSDKDFARAAEMMNVIVTDEELKERIVHGQKERLRRFDRSNVEKELLEALGPLIADKAA